LIFKNVIANLFNIPLEQAYLPAGYILLILFLIVSAGILFSSIYYAIVLNQMSNEAAQKKVTGGNFKRGLVIFQMAISIVFLVSTFMVYKQISFMKSKDLGIELDGVILCTRPASLNPDPQKRENYQAFKNKFISMNTKLTLY